jgi:hypothetical protein
MTRKRRRSARRISSAVVIVILLAYLAYNPITSWWQSIPPTSKFFLFAATGFVLMVGIGSVFAYFIYRKRVQEKIWRLAMTGWQNSSRTEAIVHERSALHLSDIELEKLAAQVYKRMGYKVQHVGHTGDHGIDVLLVNPNNQKEIVQCKQWSKPVGEATLRDLYGAMMHDNAIRGWLWAPRGFSGPAKAWAKGKPIVLVDDTEINRLMRVAYKKNK